jgi:adenylate cyclase
MKFKLDPRSLWTNYFSSVNAVIRAGLGILIVSIFTANYVRDEPLDLFTRLESLAYDARLRATMPEKIDPRIIIIDIDEKSLAAEGRWPWGRDKMATLVRQAFDTYKIKVLGFDVIFAEADVSSGLASLESMAKTSLQTNADFQQKLNELRPKLDYDNQFAEEIKKHSVVLSFSGQNNFQDTSNDLALASLPPAVFEAGAFKRPPETLVINGYSGNLAKFQDKAAATGHILPMIDFDGVLRRIPMFVQYKNDFYESMSAAVYRTYLDNAPVKVSIRDDEGDKKTKFKHTQIGETLIPLDDDGAAFIPYRGNSPMYRYISATDIIHGKLTPGELDGKIALVGATAQGIFDLRNTPVSSIYPGVEVHANMISGYLDNSIKQSPPFQISIKVLIILAIGLPLALALVKLNPVWSTIAVVAAAVLLLVVNLYWWSANYVLPLAIPLLMIGMLYLLNMAYGFFIEARAKRQITGIFGTYVPKELVEEMSKNPANYTTQGESREMTVLFSDVRNFTSISEGLSAKELTAMMNNYLTEMTQTIQADRGTIDKYIGDAIMAFWGAPLVDKNHAEHALNSALKMQQRITEIGPDYIKRGWPKLEMGVGLNCGVMNVGDMGSSFRRAYTVMGDAVNLASRLEGLTKEYGVGILVSENIVKAVPSVIYRELDRVRVKGKLEPIGIYEPVGKQGELSAESLDQIDRFHRALEHYRAQRWSDAEALLAALAHAEPKRKAYRVFLDRVANLRAQPPEQNWDGVFTFATK